MQVHLELDELIREITGCKRLSFDFPDGSTYEDVVRRLAIEYPALESILINPDQKSLVNGNLLIADEEIVPPLEMQTRQLREGVRIRFQAFIVGG